MLSLILKAGMTCLGRNGMRGRAFTNMAAPLLVNLTPHARDKPVAQGLILVIHDGLLIFSNFSDGQVYTIDIRSKSSPKKITSNPAYRFADFAVHSRYPHLIVCILEDHTRDTPAEIVNSLVVLDIRQEASTPVTPLLSGADFYSSPRFNNDGSILSWCQWNHPDMPWDGCVILMAFANLELTTF